MKRNQSTDFIKSLHTGNFHFHESIPVTSWENYVPFIDQIMEGKSHVLTHEEVFLLEPTSGTTSPTKYIPYTKGLQKEFNRAIRPWLAGLYLRWPALFGCTQYWSVSPALQDNNSHRRSGVKTGFENDTQYLGDKRSLLFQKVLTVPEIVKKCSTTEEWSYVTAFFLLRDKNLGLISIWHPSFLTLLLKDAEQNIKSLIEDIEKGTISIKSSISDYFPKQGIKPLPARAKELSCITRPGKNTFQQIWPHLKVISCWADNPDEPCLMELKEMFPSTYIQPKGIIATEAIISIPLGKKPGIPAFRSHHLEFIDIKDETIKQIHELETDKTYEVIVTTSGGLYRYRLNDLVQVTGKLFKLPYLRFIAKRDYVSDLRGEKISLPHLEKISDELKRMYPEIRFFMLSPYIDGSKACYVCFFEFNTTNIFPFQELLQYIENELNKNIHYAYARKIHQLDPLRLFLLSKNPTGSIVEHLGKSGTKRGDIKLYSLHKNTNWPLLLPGRFVDEMI